MMRQTTPERLWQKALKAVEEEREREREGGHSDPADFQSADREEISEELFRLVGDAHMKFFQPMMKRR